MAIASTHVFVDALQIARERFDYFGLRANGDTRLLERRATSHERRRRRRRRGEEEEGTGEADHESHSYAK